LQRQLGGGKKAKEVDLLCQCDERFEISGQGAEHTFNCCHYHFQELGIGGRGKAEFREATTSKKKEYSSLHVDIALF
jgi:hypothetical protein